MIQVDRIWELKMVSHDLMASLYTCTNVILGLSWRQRVGSGVGPGVTGGLLLMFFFSRKGKRSPRCIDVQYETDSLTVTYNLWVL